MIMIPILAGIIAFVVGLDQLTKYLALAHLQEYHSVPWIRGVVHFTLVHNEGAAFGILSDHRWVFLVFSSLAIVGLCVYLFRFCKTDLWVKVALSFVIGGGIGNMIDRIAVGAVVDFIELPFLWLPILNMYFPIFNIADSFVTVGVGILIVRLIRLQILEIREEKRKKAESQNGKTEDGNSHE